MNASRSAKMISVSNQDADQAVIDWLRSELGLAADRSIKPTTRINLDLGVAGMDGFDLIRAFGERFEVDISTFPVDRYFGSEAGANPISVLWSLGRMLLGKNASGLQPLCVSDLMQLARGQSGTDPEVSPH
jgi:hypothetical protein